MYIFASHGFMLLISLLLQERAKELIFNLTCVKYEIYSTTYLTSHIKALFVEKYAVCSTFQNHISHFISF